MKKFPHYKQADAMDCGPTCLRIIARHYKKKISAKKLRQLSETTRAGSSLKGLSDAAEEMGFRTLGAKISFQTLKDEAPLPCIVHWQQNHFAVVYKVKKDKVYVSDPAYGLLSYDKAEFLNNWIGQKNEQLEEGIVLLMEPTPKFFQGEFEQEQEQHGFAFLYQYLFRYKKFLAQLGIGFMVASLLQLILPFLTQSIVDVGIQNQDLQFIYLILFAQLFLFLGRTSVEFIRSWILLHLSTRINISLVSDFFIKLMNLPIAYFDTKMTGDIMQRINDHQRIEHLLTHTSLNILFSFFNLVIFGAVLAWYSYSIFFLFMLGSILYVAWVMLFMKRRKDLDYKRFAQMSEERSKVIELVNGMQEIKLHNAERQKRWSWEYLQARLFRIEMKNLALEQSQSLGSRFINELKNICITVLSATLVIKGELTLGMMLSISYILGQLNNPILQLVNFLHTLQDARISLERLSEVHQRVDEETPEAQHITHVPEKGDIKLDEVTFRYVGAPQPVIQNLSLTIPHKKTTAIVGASGSGKTTLMKLLMKFYTPESGEIRIGAFNLDHVRHKVWREHGGTVMQEGYIFNDTIANNIAIGHEGVVDRERLFHAAKVAHIKDFIESLPMAYNTKIGMEGVGMSTGQKQRILIARAVYKNPRYLFFDEATSALDANTEKAIMENLNEFMQGRTAIVIAHRLSTVKNADQIVVMDKGRIAEKGTHEQLIALKGKYFHLVKNQLELEKLTEPPLTVAKY